MYMAHAATKCQIGVCGPRYCQKPCGCLWSLLPPEAMLSGVIAATRGCADPVIHAATGACLWSLMPLEDMLMSVIFAFNPESMVHVLRWTHGCNPALMERILWRLMLITYTFTVSQRG